MPSEWHFAPWRLMDTEDQLVQDEVIDQPWHAVSADEAVQKLQSRKEGLSIREVGRRQQEFGLNKLPTGDRASLLLIFLRQFRDPLIYILLIAGVVSAVLGNWTDAAFICAVLLVNAALGAYQESKAEFSAEELEKLVKIVSTVRREGQIQEVDSDDVTPGDMVLLKSGDSVPADLRLLAVNGLRMDEALLTGESLPVNKDPKLVLDADTPLGDRANLVFAGTQVIDGRGTGVVCRIGEHSAVGKIAETLKDEPEAPPLVVRLRSFTRHISVVTLILIVILAAGQLARGKEWMEVFFLAVALAVAAIPEALPVAITVALSTATKKMARRNVIVRRLPAVEGLGACTLIATDKTGTLTSNKLTVTRVHLAGGRELELPAEGDDFDSEDDQLRQLAITGALCNEAELKTGNGDLETTGDPVDVAFLELARKLGISKAEILKEYPRTGQIPFESKRRFAASFNRRDGNIVAHVKGAAEVVLPMCGGGKGNDEVHSMAEEGFRLIAVAAGEVPQSVAENGDEGGLENLRFLGLAGIIDPVREAAPDAIERCHRAGVDVRIVTGDHPATAAAVGRTLGIGGDDDEIASGAQLKELEHDPDAYAALVSRVKIFARVEPSQKTGIVDSLQESGHFVAVTGDGVNDAPALRSAQIGVAMGKSGTDVARNAADLILTDDNFASIVNGIEEGRIAFDNVRKVVWQLISTGAAEILIFILAFLARLPMPLDAIQLLWLNLVTNGIQNLALAAEKGEPGVIDRPPRPPSQPIFNRRMIEETVLTGATVGGVGFFVFYWLLEVQGWDEFAARNVLLLLMVLFENVSILNCRSEWRSVVRIPFWSNPLLILSVAGAQALHIAAMHVPGLKDVLEIGPVTWRVWTSVLLISLSLLLVVEVYKKLRKEVAS